MASTKVAVPAWRIALSKWAYNWSYFPRLGLHRDDTLSKTPEVAEALKRLPKDIYDQRIFRLSRAVCLSGSKTILPKDQWTKWEDDVMYLQPLIEEVRKEDAERIEWSKK